MRRRNTVFLASVAVGALIPVLARAAEVAKTSSTALEEIVVTAEKHSESLQSAAAAISVVSPQALQRQGATDIRTLQFMVPSVRFNRQQSVAQMFIRGIGIASDALSLDQAVALTVNGVVQPREAGGAALYDVQRIEVLKGPQGTIYGSDAAGGVVNIVLNRPSHDSSGHASLELGDYNRVYLTLAQNMALGDKAQMRISLDSLNRKGYNSNGLDDQKSLAGRLAFSASLSEDLDIFLWGSGYHNGGLGDTGFAVPFANGSDPWKSSWDRNAVISFRPAQATHRRSVNIAEAGAEVNWNLGSATLTYIPGYVQERQRGHLVIDTGAARILQEVRNHRKQYTQELRLASNDTHATFQYLAGLYYYELDSAEWRTTVTNLNYDIPDQPNKTYAAFGQLTYSPMESLRLTGGLRFSEHHKSANGNRFTPGPTPTPIPFSASYKWTRVDWKLSAEYDVAPHSMLYATAQTGYLGGGINFFNSLSQSNKIQPEKVLSYQIGSKNTLMDNRVRLNGEAFYYDYRDYQVGLFNVGAGTNVVFNAPKSRIYGVEAETQFQITPNDQLSVNAAYMRANFRNFVVAQGVSSVVRPYDFSDFQMPFAPNFTATLGYQHTWDLSGGSRVIAAVQSQYSSSFWVSFSHGLTRCANVPLAVASQAACIDNSLLQPSYTNTNLDLTWRSPSDRLSVGVWLRNVEDKAIRFSGGDAGSLAGKGATTLAPPRTFGIRLGVDW